MLELIARKTVITRKPHKCFACCREFPSGTNMIYQTNKYDGRIYSLYSCVACEADSALWFILSEEELVFRVAR